MSSSNTLYGVLSYNQIKVEDEHAKVILTNRMIEPKDGIYDIGICMRSFEPYLLANQKTEKPVLHVSINPDPKDRLTDEQLSDIAQEYMRKMGYGNQPYLVYKHEDIDRHHLHIVSLRVDENGKKLNHNYEHRRSMDICRELEQKYGLVPADKKQQQDGTLLKAVRYDDGNVKQQIANAIRPIAKNYHFLSLKEYKALLSLYNIGMEEVRGEVNGEPYNGIVYSALDENGRKVGHPFKSSLFGKTAGYDALQKRMEKSAEVIKDKHLKERTQKVVASAMQTNKDRSGFEKELAKNGISVLFRTNDEGRIYGATFIDHEQKAVFNGSRLGKEFSANTFNDLFNEKQQGQDVWQPKQDTSKMFESFENKQDNDSGIGGLFDLLPTGIPEGDSDGEAFARRMRKKKRKQRRL